MWKLIVKWFISKAWPVIRQMLVKYGMEIAEYIFSRVRDLVLDWINKMGKEKQQQAQESYKKAQETSDPEEKKRYMYEAEFYKREVESYEQKIKDLEKRFKELKKQTEEEVKDKTKNLKAEELFDTTNKTVNNSLILKQNNNILMLEGKPKE
jgi:flagellar motility protein MotE (MotC chaperone)